jgi:hypothetical protein
MDVNKFNDFTIDTIPAYLKDTKEKLINMEISLDRYEISKSLTISLNRMLMGNKTTLNDVYDSMDKNFDDIGTKIKSIEEKIKNFNSEQKFEYFIDPEKILYIVFFKQIVYVKKLINDIYDYINSNINLIFIYCFLISKLYNKPDKITSNYIFILHKIISDTKFLSNYNNKLKKLISQEIINKVFIMIKIIYNADIDYLKLLEEFENKKIEEYKKNNSIDYSDSYKEIEKEAKIIKGGVIDINNIEDNFQRKKNSMFFKKRKINIQELYNSANLELIFQNFISIELWFGYNLFIYKSFEFNFDEYQSNVNELIKSKGLEKNYLLTLNYLNDINAPDVGIIPIVGGSIISTINEKNMLNSDYYSKYLKYKKKYQNLKNTFN